MITLTAIGHKQRRNRNYRRVWPVAPTSGIGTTSPSSALQVAGPIATSFGSKTSAYMVTASDSVISANTGSGAFAITLPSASGITGRQYTISKVDASTNTLTVASAGGTIGGASAQYMNYSGAFITVVSDGTNWILLNNNTIATNPSAYNSGRMTLTSGTAVTTIDVTAATTVYYTPFNGNRVALYDGTANWNIVAFSEQTLSLGTLTAGANYDVFAYNSAGTVSLVLGAAWTNNTTRSTALALQDGVWVQSGTTTRRYLGTIRTTSTTTTEDSNVKRFVWNANNRVPRTQMQTDTTTNWANAGNGAWSAMNSGNAAWQEQFLIGLAGDPVESGIDMYVSYMGSIGIALDSTSAVNSSNSTVSYTCCTNVAVNSSVHYRGYPAAGYHYMQGLQTTQSSTTVYFYGSTLSSCGGGGAGCLNSGMYTRLLQ